MLLFLIIATITLATVITLGTLGISFEEPEDIASVKIFHIKLHQLIPDSIANFLAIVLPLIIGVILGYILGDKL